MPRRFSRYPSNAIAPTAKYNISYQISSKISAPKADNNTNCGIWGGFVALDGCLLDCRGICDLHPEKKRKEEKKKAHAVTRLLAILDQRILKRDLLRAHPRTARE